MPNFFSSSKKTDKAAEEASKRIQGAFFDSGDPYGDPRTAASYYQSEYGRSKKPPILHVPQSQDEGQASSAASAPAMEEGSVATEEREVRLEKRQFMTFQGGSNIQFDERKRIATIGYLEIRARKKGDFEDSHWNGSLRKSECSSTEWAYLEAAQEISVPVQITPDGSIGPPTIDKDAARQIKTQIAEHMAAKGNVGLSRT